MTAMGILFVYQILTWKLSDFFSNLQTWKKKRNEGMLGELLYLHREIDQRVLGK